MLSCCRHAIELPSQLCINGGNVGAACAKQPSWTRRSSRCRQDNCVIVTARADAVDLSDGKAEGDVITVSLGAWAAFVGGLRSGDFGPPANGATRRAH
ncbi:DUF397 domain-containing protein [Micromonospora haikouensis]|uniref:DUF397 domain-containing protein n=1 Tax=Micromonospora haikouensis TaxID=686309 RepID=UPI0037B5A106